MTHSYFQQLKELIKLEKEADSLQFQAIIQNASIHEKKESGLTWYPLIIRSTEITKADYLNVELEKTNSVSQSHQFRVGGMAVLYSQHNAKEYRIKGTVKSVQAQKIILQIPQDELPDWTNEGKLAIDILFDEQSYKEMNDALNLAEKHLGTNGLSKILIGEEKPAFDVDSEINTSFSHLNFSQQKALKLCSSAKNLAVVHGPPGTGKTTTIVQIAKELVRKGEKIIASAPSNTAIDLLCKKMDSEGLKVLRLGNPSKINKKTLALTLEEQIKNHTSFKDIKNYKIQAKEYISMAHKYKRNFGQAEREQRKLLFSEAKKLMQLAENIEEYIVSSLLEKADIVAGTPMGLNNYLKNLKIAFHTAIIDEAGQSLEPFCWIVASYAPKLILAGDHQQLPPTVKNKNIQAELGVSLLEKIVKLHPEAVTLLDEQYRMNENIMNFSSDFFYNGQLKAHPSVSSILLFENDFPLEFVDTAGCGFEEQIEGTSVFNKEEANLLKHHLLDYRQKSGVENASLAIISPYKEQVNQLSEIIKQEEIDNWKLNINTIDSFQGQEKDIVYISLVRSNTKGEIGFLNDLRRLNVAITRAKKKVVIIGDSATLCRHPFYSQLVSYSEKLDSYKTAWEWI